MRKLPIAVVVSAAIHTAAIAYVRMRPTPVLTAIQPVTHVEITVKEPDPVAVTLLDDDTRGDSATQRATGIGPRASGPERQRASGFGLRASGQETQNRQQNQHPETKTERHSGLMAMRQPNVDRPVTDAFVERFLASSKPLAPRDTETAQRADDIATLESDLANPRWVANHSGDEVAMARAAHAGLRDEQAHAELQQDGRGTKAEHTTFTEKFEPDGTVHIADEKNLKFHGASATFDVTDWAMRSHGMDPYASAKLRALDHTRDERVAIGKRYKHQLLSQSRQLMQQNLAYLWQKTRDASERRQAVFELWDEVAETGEPDVVAGGADARLYLIGFVRAHLPPGSPDAFTTDELARLNAHRRSQQTFDPY